MNLSKEEILEIPLNKVLEHLGYKYDLSRTSKRSPVMENEKEKIIVNRLSSGIYLYFNPNQEQDRGNILNFCKNRGLKLEEVLNAYFKDEKIEKSHTLQIENKNDRKAEIKEKIEIFDNFNKINNNHFYLKNRGIDQSRFNFKNLKQNERGNICVPLYETIILDNRTIFIPCGFNEKFNKSFIPNGGDKPIKNAIRGKKGIEILLEENTKESEIKKIIISESFLDSISFAEIKDFSNKENLIVGTGGNPTQESIKSIEKLATKFSNADFYICFDNDEKGKKFASTFCSVIAEQVPQEKIKIYKPKTKDFNDDLKIIKEFNFDKDKFYSFELKDIKRLQEEKIQREKNNQKTRSFSR